MFVKLRRTNYCFYQKSQYIISINKKIKWLRFLFAVLGQLPPRETAPRKITPYHKIFPKDNCRTQVNFPKRALRMNWGELCMGGSRINFRVLQNFIKKSITIRSAQSKGFYCRLFWPKLCWNGDIMALAWVAKLSEQRDIFNWWHYGLVKKQLQYTYWSISSKLKATRRLNLVRW